VDKLKLDQILKWVATVVLVIGAGVNGLGFRPEGPIILALGGYIWLVVAIMWREWSLVATNFVMSTVGIVTLYISYFG